MSTLCSGNQKIAGFLKQILGAFPQRDGTRLYYPAVVGVLFVGAIALPATAQEQNIELKIGVVQRFGEEATERLTLQATEGDRLTLKFLGGDRQPQTLQTTSVVVEPLGQKISPPKLAEKIILSNHRSFETAEDNALNWRKQGIAVEIAQPGRWQVWAKRDVYRTPLLRRLLLESLQTQSKSAAYLDAQVQAQELKISWVLNGNRYSREQMEIVAGKNVIEVKQSKVGTTKETSNLYAGKLQLQPNAYHTYTLVNRVPIETYLRGVVPHEIGPAAPYNAVEAQAILARTYALRNLRRFAIDNYELCADTNCQVYRGLRGTVSTADGAIAATKGQVITYKNELVDALYSAATGGITALFNDIWNGQNPPYLQPVIDSAGKVWDLSKQPLGNEENLRQFISLKKGFNEDEWSMFRWSRESTLPEIGEFLQRYLKRINNTRTKFTKVQQVKIVKRSPFGRILKMSVQTDGGTIELEKDDIRSAFLAPLSTLFYLEPIYNADKTLKGYAFIGGGMGHGVGLSQSGAYHLAKIGWSSQKILSFYYPGTELQPLSDRLVFWQEPSLPPQK